MLAPLHDAEAAPPVQAERELLRLVDGGCNVPFGAWARTVREGRLELIGVLESAERVLRAKAEGPVPEDVAARVWKALEAELGDSPGADSVADAPVAETVAGEHSGRETGARRQP